MRRSLALAAALPAGLLAACVSAPMEATEPSSDARIRSQADLQAYLDAFNDRRYAEQIAYYAPDVSYAVGSLTLDSPQAIADFYDDFHDYVREHVEIAAYAQTGDTVAVAMPTRFEAFRTYDKHGLSFPEGEVREVVSFIFYELEDGKIRRIRVARYNGDARDPQD